MTNNKSVENNKSLVKVNQQLVNQKESMNLSLNTNENIFFYAERGVGKKMLFEPNNLEINKDYYGFVHVQGDRKKINSFLKPLQKKQCILFSIHYSKFIESGANLRDEGYRLVCEGLSRTYFHNEDNELYHLTPGGIIGFLIYINTKNNPVMIREYSSLGIRYLVFNEILKRTEECSIERCHDLITRYTKTSFLQSNILPTSFSNDSFLSAALNSYFSYNETSREAIGNNYVTNRVMEYENKLYFPKDGHIYVDENKGATINQLPLKLDKPLFAGQLADQYYRQGNLSKLLPEKSSTDLAGVREERALLLKHDILTPAFQNLIIKLSRGEYQIALALRTAIARVVFAGDIGDKLQTGFWFYGPPRTGKSLAQKIIAMFGHSEIISGNVTNFSTDTYKSASVIIFPDVLSFSSEQLQLLRRLLGRDPLSGERKYQQGSLNYVSKATVVITSNRYPGDIKSLNFEEYRDKLIFVPFYNAVSDEEIDPNLIHKITNFKEEFLIWALTVPRIFLDKQVRAEEYYQLVGRPRDGGDDIFDEFIQSTLYTIDPDWKCPSETKIVNKWEDGVINLFDNKTCSIDRNSLKNLYEEWCKNVLKEKHDTNGFFTKIKNTLNSARYKLNLKESRPNVSGVRPRVFENIIYPTPEVKKQSDQGLNNLIPVRTIRIKDHINKQDLFEQAIFGMDPDLGNGLLNKNESYQKLLQFKYNSQVKLDHFLKDAFDDQDSNLPWYDATAPYSSEEETTSLPLSERENEKLVPSSKITDEEILQEEVTTFFKRKGLNKIIAPKRFLYSKDKPSKLLTGRVRNFINTYKSIRKYIL